MTKNEFLELEYRVMSSVLSKIKSDLKQDVFGENIKLKEIFNCFKELDLNWEHKYCYEVMLAFKNLKMYLQNFGTWSTRATYEDGSYISVSEIFLQYFDFKKNTDGSYSREGNENFCTIDISQDDNFDLMEIYFKETHQMHIISIDELFISDDGKLNICTVKEL